MNNVINWFEIPVADMDRAVAFYEPVMQVSLRRETMDCAELAVFPHQDPAPGGALAKFEGIAPSAQGAIIYLHTDHLAATLERFNSLLPMPDLVRAERRARHLSKLEVEKWELPAAGALPRWGQLPLQRCPITKVASQAMSGQLAMLESYAADSSPMADLAKLQQRKQAQSAAADQKLAQLQAQLANSSPDASMQTRLIGPGDTATLRRRLLHELRSLAEANTPVPPA